MQEFVTPCESTTTHDDTSGGGVTVRSSKLYLGHFGQLVNINEQIVLARIFNKV